jgi:hypothetical protein
VPRRFIGGATGRTPRQKRDPSRSAAIQEERCKSCRKFDRVMRMLAFGWLIIALGLCAMLWADGNFAFSQK